DVWPDISAWANETRQQFGLAPLTNWAGVIAGHDCVVSPVPPIFDATVADHVGHVDHVGFLVPRVSPAAQPVDWPAGDGPKVVVGLSTTYQQHEDLLQTILDALGSLPARGIASTAGQVDIDTLRCPPNVLVREFVDHHALLGSADVMV